MRGVACVVAGLVLGLCCTATAQKRVLVLMQDKKVAETHSLFFDALEKSGLDLDLKSDNSANLREYDTWLYDHLIILAPKATGFGKIDQQTILDFIDGGGNVLLTVSSDASERMRNIASECGVDVDDKGTVVYDHFNHIGDDHTLITTDVWVKSEAIVGTSLKAPVVYKGTALSVPPEIELVSVALSASATAYSHGPGQALAEPPTLLAGSAVTLVALLQARNNGRVLVSGSLNLFSNKLWQQKVDGSASGNAAFCTSVALWTFAQRGVLRAGALRHEVTAPYRTVQPAQYRVNDDVRVSLDILEYTDGVERPYRANDVQIEFTMLDPHVRLSMQQTDNGTFYVEFKVPDVYGVFKYVVEYKRLGYSRVALQHLVPVRPFKHDEFERFLLPAYPYYASAFSTMIAFFLVGFFVLYHK